MAGGTNFSVDLAALGDAIGQISGERDTISGGITSLRGTFTTVEDHWKSPAGDSFGTLVTKFNSVTDTMMGLLDEAIGKMRTARDNYASTEQTNTDNLQLKYGSDTPPDPGSDAPPDPGSDAPPPGSDQPPLPAPAPATSHLTARQG